MPANEYLSVDDMKALLRDNQNAHDVDYERAIAAASRQIDDYCGRRFWKDTTPTQRLFRAEGPDLLLTGDYASTTGLIVATDEDDDGSFETTWETTDWQAEPFERMNGRPYTRLAAVGAREFPTCGRRARVRVTATWGWPEVPSEVRQACQVLSVAHFKSKDLTGGAAGSELATQQFGGFRFGRVRVASFDPHAEALLQSLRVHALA